MKRNDISFTPGLDVNDSLANYWLHQVSTRLRREICWIRVERGTSESQQEYLPTFTDQESYALGLGRFYEKKSEFMQTDATAKYLTSQLEVSPPTPTEYHYGSFGWLKETFGLNDTSCFILALGLITNIDSAAGAIIASTLNNPHMTKPTLALVQRIWDKPKELYNVINPSHPLTAFGVLTIETNHREEQLLNWESTLTIPALVSRQLLFPEDSLLEGLTPIKPEQCVDEKTSNQIRLAVSKLKSESVPSLRVVPIRIPFGSSPKNVVKTASFFTQVPIVEYTGNLISLSSPVLLKPLITYCWLRGLDLFIDLDTMKSQSEDEHSFVKVLASLKSIPTTVYLGYSDRRVIDLFPKSFLNSHIEIKPSSFEQRVQYWTDALEDQSVAEEELLEISRRFRFEQNTINLICKGLINSGVTITHSDLLDACRLMVSLDDIEFAQKVEPRFEHEKLILPKKQAIQFNEIKTAMLNLTKVFYYWGLAKVWNEGGISCLFTGPSGTGKTMAAEVLAQQLELPMYRIDLSQIVNKYIGETEKNLKLLFDAAEASDMILFFDEADALFGKRTEIKDAHDRYANITVSYLLERMERFKGFSILATNRRKDIDEAFHRRIRYVLEFPKPSKQERYLIWKQQFPSSIDTSEIDIEFLASQFSLTGGSIRSIALNVCLQSADKKGEPKLGMREIMIAVKREYDKMEKVVNLDHFGSHSNIIRELEGNGS